MSRFKEMFPETFEVRAGACSNCAAELSGKPWYLELIHDYVAQLQSL